MTLGEMVAQVSDWLKEPVREGVATAAINDAISDLWEAEIQVAIANFMGGPTTVSLAQGVERADIVLITDPAITLAMTTVAGGALPNHSVKAAFTYVTESGAETLMSPSTTQAVLANNLAKVTGPVPVSLAAGWNLYCDDGSNRWGKQNDAPLDFQDAEGNAILWTEPVDGIKLAPGRQSPPTANITAESIAYITHMEVQLPDTTWKAYNQADIDSALMRGLAGSIAAGSAYQFYAFDLINNTRLEIRPKTGTAISPRMFFISRPPRSKVSTTVLPFKSPGEEAYIRYRALALIKRTNEEYPGADSWDAQANEKKQSILLALTQTNSKRNRTITPYLP